MAGLAALSGTDAAIFAFCFYTRIRPETLLMLHHAVLGFVFAAKTRMLLFIAK